MQVHPFADSLVLAPPEPAPLMVMNAAARRIWDASGGDLGAEPLASLIAGLPGAVSPAPQQRHGIARSRNRPSGRSRRETRAVYSLGSQLVEVRFRPPILERLIAQRFGYARLEVEAANAIRLELTQDRDGYRLNDEIGGAVRAASPEELVGALVRRLIELNHPNRRWLGVFHAAAVAGPDGGAILFPGWNGAGKSTLVTALLAAGYAYLSDDCCPLTELGTIVPVPFAICLKEGSWAVASRYLPSVASVSVTVTKTFRCRFVPPPRIADSAAPLRRVLFPQYRPGAREQLARLRPVEMLARLTGSRAWLSRRADELALLLGLLERVPAYSLTFSDLDRALTLLQALHDGEGGTGNSACIQFR